MTWNWKIFLPLGIVAILVLVILYSQLGKVMPVKKGQLPTNPITEKPTTLPPATGNVDEALNAVIAAVNDELTVLDEETGDVSLIDLDSQAISNFGQSFNENEF